MALSSVIYHLKVNVSDVDRGVYEALDLRVARHPSESLRYLLTRVLAYALSYEEGIAFSKGGISDTDEPPVSVRDPTGILLAWIDVGSPSAERLHKASKAARRVALFTHVELALLQKEAASKAIHKVEQLAVWRLEPAFLDALEKVVERNTELELTRDEENLYLTVRGQTLQGVLTRCALSVPA